VGGGSFRDARDEEPSMIALDFSEPDLQNRLRAFAEDTSGSPAVEETVRGVLRDVQTRGDQALIDLALKFDKARLGAVMLDPAHLQQAGQSLEDSWRKEFQRVLEAVEFYNRKSMPRDWEVTNPHGALVGERFFPVSRVGIYVPGGGVPLVSTVLMTVPLAKIAGVPEIVVATPPGPDGLPDRFLLAALDFLGVKEVLVSGGAQAIAAMAYGTESLPAVDKVFGPGNAYVMEAKRQLLGTVGVDLLPGPSEVMIIADAQVPADWVAADLIAQAEHGSGKEKVYLVAQEGFDLDAMQKALGAQLPKRRHQSKVEKVLEKSLMVVRTSDCEQSAIVANWIAPEHLQLMTSDAGCDYLSKKITTAGAVLIGNYSPAAVGDFAAGPSHVLPTGRTSRFFSGLTVSDFMRRSSTLRYDRESLQKALPTMDAFAQMEKLDGHGFSGTIRLS